MEPHLEARLLSGAAALPLALDDRTITSLSRYLELLLFWNRRINLTAIRSPEAIIDKHFVDSLAVVPHIPATARTLADIGTGPGFPGAVIALARPDLTVSLVESIHKKTAFLEALRRDLPLPNVEIHTARAEDWARSHPTRPDVVVSRATWDLLDWLAKAPDWVRPSGLILGMEADISHPLPPNATRHPYAHPSGSRSIVTLHP